MRVFGSVPVIGGIRAGASIPVGRGVPIEGGWVGGRYYFPRRLRRVVAWAIAIAIIFSIFSEANHQHTQKLNEEGQALVQPGWQEESDACPKDHNFVRDETGKWNCIP